MLGGGRWQKGERCEDLDKRRTGGAQRGRDVGRGEAGNERNREHEHEAATCCCVAALVVRFVRSHSLTGLFSLCTSSCVVLLGRHRRGHYCHHGFDIVVATIVVHIVWPPSRI